jgi:hypothetical protein
VRPAELAVAIVFGSMPLWLGCSGASPVNPADGGRDAGMNVVETDAALDSGPHPVTVSCQRMDVLFVIDNSDSMRDEQRNLAENAPRFLEALRKFRGGKVDFRIGVTTTSMARSSEIADPGDQAGTLLKTPDMPHPWLSADDPQLEEKFASLSTVGTDGSWEEHPLKTLRAALTEPSGDSAQFLRPDALLALVVITDEDDTSSEGDNPLQPGAPIPVGTFVSAFDALKGSRTAWSATVIAGDTAPMCSTGFGNALFAARLLDFVAKAQGSGVFSSICQGDLSASLDDALSAFAAACDLL